MNTQLTAFLLAVLLGVISSALGYSLFRFGSAYIKYRGARFGGAVAIAGMAFYLMSSFYFQQIKSEDRVREQVRQKVIEALTEYDTCVAHERSVASCRDQSAALRDSCRDLTH